MPYHLSGRTVVNTLGAAFFVIVLAHAGPAVARSHDYPARPAVQKFIDKMVANHGFNRATLEALFAGARHRQSIIDSMNRPAESLPWYRYRHIFLTRQRTAGGIAFRHEHRAALDRAEKVYGVPPAIVTAIIGVESRYGSNKGKYRVIDALATLSFDYPPRAGFFRKELAQYLLLSREQQFNPAKMTGSYAGAMGAPQFISSSYRKYAVDFSGDGKSNLWDNWPDIIGSIANYFAKNGWQRDAGVAVPAKLNSGVPAGIKPGKATTAQALRKAGVQFSDKIDGDARASLIELDTGDGDKQYWVGLRNFKVIMSYNHSPLYAMAVYQLSNAIKKGKRGSAG